MILRPPRSTRTYTLFPAPTLFVSNLVITSGPGPPITEKRSSDEGRICLRLLRRQRDFTRHLGRLGYPNPAMGARRRVRLCALPRLRQGNIDRPARGETGQPPVSSQIPQPTAVLHPLLTALNRPVPSTQSATSLPRQPPSPARHPTPPIPPPPP